MAAGFSFICVSHRFLPITSFCFNRFACLIYFNFDLLEYSFIDFDAFSLTLKYFNYEYLFDIILNYKHITQFYQ